MQIPAEYGEDYIVLAISVGLATIGVCVFSAVTSVAALFDFWGDKIVRKIRTSFLLFVLFICLLSVSGCGSNQVEENDLVFEEITIHKTNGTKINGYEVVGCAEDIAVVNIPAYINGKPVVSIKWGVFSNRTSIKEIVIPSTIEYSIAGAFTGCKNVEKLTTSNPDFASAFSKSLKYLYLSNGCSKIDTMEFANYRSLLEVHIPISVTIIEDGTNYTYVGVNGHTPSKFDYLPFVGCNPELKIYCEATSKPKNWGNFWNYVNDYQKATVYWGNDDTDTSANEGEKTTLKHIATASISTISNYYSSGSRIVEKNGITIKLDKGESCCGFCWDLSNEKLKSNTTYVIKFKNVSIAGATYSEGVRLRTDWNDDTYNFLRYYNTKGKRFDIITAGGISDSYYQWLTQETYDTFEMEFEFLHSGVESSKYKGIYFSFVYVEDQISFDTISIYEVIYE